MQSFVFVIFGSMLFMNSAFAADSLISSHTTHPVLEALPSASPQASFQIAKTYYLPDYQLLLGEEDKQKYEHRGECISFEHIGEYESKGYDCKPYQSYSLREPCYICTPKPCPVGYSTEVKENSCESRTGYQESYSFGGYSDGEKCGKCDYKELSCASGYSTSYQSVSDCGTTGSAGWTFTSNGYSGEKKCGKCTAKSCLSGYSKTYSDVSKCGSKGSKGWSWEKSSQYAGNSVCGKCSKLSCNSPYTSGITSCSPSDGYTLKQDSGRYNGDTVCGYCQPNNCSGTKQKDCNTSNGYTFTQTCKSGTTIYGTCKANTCSGTPEGGCGSGYAWSSNGCISAGKKYGTCTALSCPSGEMTETACFEQKNGRLGWNWAKTSNFVGSTPCGKCTAKKCVSGWLISEMSQHCTPLDWYWVFTPVPGGEYSGAEECGTCVLNCSNDIFGSTPTQSYIDPVPDILGNIAGDYIPWVRHNRLCPREGVGTDPVSGGKGCYYSCNLQSAYNSWMGYASSATNVMELVRNCISNCRIVAQELTSWYSSSSTEVQRKKDESICYTMCLMAAQKKYRELTKNGGGNSDYWTFYCPSDMKMCCNGNVASKNGYDYTLPDGTTLTPFKCGSDSQPLRTSCRRNNCSSWD